MVRSCFPLIVPRGEEGDEELEEEENGGWVARGRVAGFVGGEEIRVGLLLVCE